MAVPIIAANWKMNATLAEARALVTRMRPGLEAIGGAEKVLCPPFTALAAVQELLGGSSIGLGAQDMYFEDSGAYTGEVSPAMLAELCRFVIVGHSERRHVLGETDHDVARKVEAAARHGLRPILCVGERLEEREGGTANTVVERQLEQGLARVSSAEGLLVAYEPVWAIGTGRAATPDDAQAMMAHVRLRVAERYGREAASQVPLLYGGSVTADNVAGFIREKDVGGALVGGASLKPDGFVDLVRNAAEAAA